MSQDSRIEKDSCGVARLGNALLTDISGCQNVGTGSDWFPLVFDEGVFVDKSLLIRDVLQGMQVKLFCRPRRFGKTLAITMLQDFFECAPCGNPVRARERFEHLSIWEADSAKWRAHQGAYPVVSLSLKEAEASTWDGIRDRLQEVIAREFSRHNYLLARDALDSYKRPVFERIMAKTATDAELQTSLRLLTEALESHHGKPSIVLIDEYDAPILHAYDYGAYEQAAAFMRPLLSAALKTNPHLYRGVLTGVQRISKESIFSGLNNIEVNTPLSQDADERFGFDSNEVGLLAGYLGHGDKLEEVRSWYDGYRFGDVEIYNPWSVLMYFAQGCVAQPYWTNTSGNLSLAHALGGEDTVAADELLLMLEPGAVAEQPIDPNIAYGELGKVPGAAWSVLYMSGYLTTDDTSFPADPTRYRPLRVPNYEVRALYRREVVDRAQTMAGGPRRLRPLHEAFVRGNAEAFDKELGAIVGNSASMYDLTAESQCHMLLMGLLFGIPGYGDPRSNREAGYGRFDLQIAPQSEELPLITVEVKFMAAADYGRLGEKGPERLGALAHEALAQIGCRHYDAEAADGPVLRWGIAFGGKRVSAACEVRRG